MPCADPARQGRLDVCRPRSAAATFRYGLVERRPSEPGHTALKYTVRLLLRHKLFAVLAIGLIASAIAACSVVFGLFDAITNPILTIRDPEELRTIAYHGDGRNQVSTAILNEQIRSMASVASAAGSLRVSYSLVSRGSETRPAEVLRVSAAYFSVLGIDAVHGRLLGPGDLLSEARPVVVSSGMWARWFAGRPWSDSARILLNGDPRPVVGVIAPEADFPGANTDVWQLEFPSQPLRYSLLRRKPGVSNEALFAELQVVAARLASAASEAPRSTWFTIKPAVGRPFDLLGFHYALIAAVAAVYLVACLNLANLQLARGLQRTSELATLSALGASKQNLIMLAVREAGILCMGGFAASVWLTVIGVQVTRSVIPPAFGDYLVRPQLSWRVFAFSAFVALSATLIISLLPALRLSQWDISQALKPGAAQVKSSAAARRAIVVAQIALTLAVLVGAGLLSRTVVRLHDFDLGPNAGRLLYASMFLSKRDAADSRRAGAALVDLAASIRSEPLVAGVSTVRFMKPDQATLSVAVPGNLPSTIWPVLSYRVVSADYFRTLGVPVIAGRDFADGGGDGVIVDQMTAAWLWPGSSGVGREVKLGDTRSAAPWLPVVGVAAMMPTALRADMGEAAVPRMGDVVVSLGNDTAGLTPMTSVGLIVRSEFADSTARLRNLLERKLRELGPNVQRVTVSPPYEPQRLRDLLDRQGFIAAVFVAFGLLALLVTAVGVYSETLQRVAAKRREYAVRIALGAEAAGIRGLVMHEANVPVLIGIAAGLLCAVFTVDWLGAFVRSEADRYDSVAYGLVALGTFVTTSVMSYVVALRAVPKDLVAALGSI